MCFRRFVATWAFAVWKESPSRWCGAVGFGCSCGAVRFPLRAERGGVNESSCGSRVFHLTLHRYREEILARGKDSGGRNSDLGKEIWIVVSVRLWFGLVMIVFGVSGASDCDERVPSLRVMI